MNKANIEAWSTYQINSADAQAFEAKFHLSLQVKFDWNLISMMKASFAADVQS